MSPYHEVRSELQEKVEFRIINASFLGHDGKNVPRVLVEGRYDDNGVPKALRIEVRIESFIDTLLDQLAGFKFRRLEEK